MLTHTHTHTHTNTVTGSPRNVSVRRMTTTFAFVSWSAPTGNNPPVVGYEVFYQTENGEGLSGDGEGLYQAEADGRTSGGETDAAQLSLVVAGLASTSSYSFFVVAFGGDLPSAPSNTVTISPSG